MKTRRDFLIDVGTAAAATALVASTTDAAPAPKVERRQAAPRSAGEMEQWLLSTGKPQLDPRLIAVVKGQLKVG